MIALLSACADRTVVSTSPPASSIVPESRLEELLVRSSQDPTVREAFGREFLRTVVFLRVDEATAKAAQEGNLNQVRFFKVRTTDGGEAMALYTSERRLTEAAGVQPAIPITGKQALILGRGLRVSLNYGLVPAAVWEPENAAALLLLNPAHD